MWESHSDCCSILLGCMDRGAVHDDHPWFGDPFRTRLLVEEETEVCHTFATCSKVFSVDVLEIHEPLARLSWSYHLCVTAPYSRHMQEVTVTSSTL